MRAFSQGDAAAFEVVFERHRSWLLRMLRNKLRGAGVAEDDIAQDIAQDTWLTVVRTSGQYQASARFTTWLFGIAQHRFIDHLRKIDKYAEPVQTTVLLEDDNNEAMADLSFDPAMIEENRDLLARFSVALRALPADQSEVFMLVSEAGMSVPEAAASMQLPLETVKSRLRYARAKLAQVLEGLRA
jgi:RNA polymerase sigma factor (sigma-70 family)